jgi:hypothetical protein
LTPPYLAGITAIPIEPLYFLNVFWIQDRDQFCPFSWQGFHFVIQLHPIKTAMLRIWIDANDRPRKPAFALPKFGIEKNLHPVADFELLCHVRLFAVARPTHQADPRHDQNAAIDCPLSFTCHETTGQDVNSLEEENAASKDEHYSEDIERNFHENFHYWRENVAMIILSQEPMLRRPVLRPKGVSRWRLER